MMAGRGVGLTAAGGPARHIPVMLSEVIEALDPRDGKHFIDGTFGAGGYTRGLLESARCSVLAIDRDPDAAKFARALEERFPGRLKFVLGRYAEMREIAEREGIGAIDGVTLDLGVSSMQLDVADRGFAYREDAPLDMRMDPTGGPTAADVLNTYPKGELTRVLREYGEERFASRIATAIVRERDTEPFTTSARLVELLYREIPAPARRTGGHPAKRTFQALRMEVNDELGVLRRAVPAAIDSLAVGGRVVVESYHSLEDRLVKRAFAAVTRLDVPPDLPFVPPDMEPALRLVTRGAERADAAEIEANPRAASVRLRAIERVRPDSRGEA